MEEKNMRLSQVARKLNVGLSTITDYLAAKGIFVENNPNTKITTSQFNMLIDELRIDRHNYEFSNEGEVIIYKNDKNNQSNQINEIILSIISSKELQKIINDTEFYFEKARDAFNKFERLNPFLLKVDMMDTHDVVIGGSILNAIERFQKSKKVFSEYLEEIKSDRERYQLFVSIGKVVAYFDKTGYKKKEWNEYSDKRYIAKSGVNQTNWTLNLLYYKAYGIDKVSENIRNAILFIKNPSNNLTMLSGSHRRALVNNILNKEYNPSEFNTDIFKFFSKFKMAPINPENLGIIYSQIIYSNDLKNIWLKNNNPRINGSENEGNDEEEGEEVINYTSDYNNEHFHENIEDQLEITEDVKAFASLITYSKVTPPLAIGLFGNWGSGKSFFMKKLKKEITFISKDQSYSGFCQNIVHIEFNAWHYTDANLWACIMLNIFDGLKAYAKDNEGEESIKELLHQKIATSKQLMEEAKAQYKNAIIEKRKQKKI